MKYSYNWLKELSGTKLSPEKAAELLTMHSLELEGVEKIGNDFDKIVVGEILEIKKHPNADKLQIAKVNVGKDKLQIVCGAPNIEVGQKVPVALVGAKLPASTREDDRSSKRGGPNGLEIKEASIRGEKSFGMLCALDELGLGKDHSGIFILDKNAKIGEPAKKYLGVEDDTIFEIKVLPDRAHDAMSHVGVAREISVLENKNFAYDFDGIKLPNKKSKKLKVEIKDKKLCPRYIGAVMTQVEIKDSPNWMKKRLENCGIRPINNVVDATNYVMLELGQPMHAFDFFKISDQGPRNKEQGTKKLQSASWRTNSKAQIIVRRAKNKEKLVLLDDSILELNDSDLLITNGETPLALAGIMGGKNSGINENTKTIILEAANFNATNIRRTRVRLGLKTESSDRFEKEIDPNLAEKAITRIIEILEHTANGKLDGISDIYPKKIKPWKIKLDLEYVNSLLGEKVPQKEIIKILNLLGISTTIQPYKVVCTVPTYRIDLKTQEDLIEEIGRIWGYEKIEAKPLIEPVISAKVNEQLDFEQKTREKLVGLGFDEMYNYSFYSQADADNCGLEEKNHHKLANPMNPDQELVRASMAPNILKNIRENIKNFEEFDIFELGRTYKKDKNKTKEDRTLFAVQVFSSNQKEAFYFSKGNLENFLESLGVKENVVYKKNEMLSKGFWCNYVKSAKVEINGEIVGYVGEFNPLTLEKYKIKKSVGFFDINTEKLLKVLPKTKVYKSINRFPEVVRDLSMIVSDSATYAEIKKVIEKVGGNLVENVELFDYFSAKKSLAVRISMNAHDKTLENTEIDEVMKKIISNLEKELKIEIRK